MKTFAIACRRLIPLLVIALLAAGCTTVRVSDYKDLQPTMTPESFFTGPKSAHGVVKNRSGRVIRYFNANIIGSEKDGVFTLEEDFVFNDGEKQRRVWSLSKKADGTYRGTTGDGDIGVTIDDRMYLTTPKTPVNESKMYKFGIRVGEILLVIVKPS